VALSTGIGHGAHADRITHPEMTDAAPDRCDLANNFMSWDTSVFQWTPIPIDEMDIRSTDTTVADLDLHILGSEGAWVIGEWLESSILVRGAPGIESDRGVFVGLNFRSHGE
jgi:hypothetical protein